ncbi:MBL fold metallo-hydrolase [Chloroflexales bacterium ZM16-3]|nr:MBL fold metallo-hydrolase [Chloroflexales bacterium ZM16-3]
MKLSAPANSTLLLLDTGHCLVSAHHVMRGVGREPMACRALVALIGHPQHGWTLFDTGYAPRMLEATRRLPWRLYRLATPLRIRPEQAAVRQLAQIGLAPADIRRVIISHFHADHVAGLRDFPDVPVIASAEAFVSIAGRRGLNALRRAHIPALMPDDMAARAVALPAFTGPPLPHLGPTHDLFGDGSLLLVNLPGHARGQIGALLQTESGPVLLAADGAWTSRAIREQRPPARLTYFFVDDARAVGRTLANLGAFAAARPDVRIVPCHCPEVVI